MGLVTQWRILETEASVETTEPLPWKRFAKDYMINKNRNVE